MERIRIWILAIRPKTLPAALAPVIVGTSLAWADGVFSFFPALAAGLVALLLQVGANLANDYFDGINGYGPWVLLPLLTLPLAMYWSGFVGRHADAALNRALAGTANLTLIFAVLFAIGLAAWV